MLLWNINLVYELNPFPISLCRKYFSFSIFFFLDYFSYDFYPTSEP